MASKSTTADPFTIIEAWEKFRQESFPRGELTNQEEAKECFYAGAQETLHIASEAIHIAQQVSNTRKRYLEIIEYLQARESEAKEIISGLLEQLDKTESVATLYRLKPLAKAFLERKKGGETRARKISSIRRTQVTDALHAEELAGTKPRAINKRIAAKLNLTPQRIGVLRAQLKRIKQPGD
jgi:hypothetical protein